MKIKIPRILLSQNIKTGSGYNQFHTKTGDYTPAITKGTCRLPAGPKQGMLFRQTIKKYPDVI